MLTRLTISLSRQEREALQTMAEREMRGPREHVRYLLRAEMCRLGLLDCEATDDAGTKGVSETRTGIDGGYGR